MSFDPVPPLFEPDDSPLLRLVASLAILATSFFIAALLCIAAGADDAALVMCGLVMAVGAIVLSAVSVEDE